MLQPRFHRRILSAICAVSASAAVPAHADVIAVIAIDTGTSASVQIADASVAQGRVFIEEPVGALSVGAGPDAAGEARYGARSGNVTSGFVRFSSSRPSIAATSFSGAMPAGLPLASSRLTSPFGSRRNPLTGSSQHHAGVDLAAPAGAPVAATGSGVVSFAGYAGGYGLVVVLDHGDGVQTRYAHLSRLGVARGQAVDGGDTVGLVGSTGRSTGPHLHYEVRAHGRPVDPLRY